MKEEERPEIGENAKRRFSIRRKRMKNEKEQMKDEEEGQ